MIWGGKKIFRCGNLNKFVPRAQGAKENEEIEQNFDLKG